MNEDQLRQLQIPPEAKDRPARSFWTIVFVVALLLGGALYLAVPRASDAQRVVKAGPSAAPGAGSTNAPTSTRPAPATTAASTAPAPQVSAPATAAAAVATAPGEVVLTVSGYIINHERIEISPRFMGLVTWIGVRKGDAVTNGQVLVRLDETEYRARLQEQEGRLANARTGVEKAGHAYERIQNLARERIESAQLEDDARLALESARATVREVEGQIAQTRTYLDWCTIRSPINGVVLEKLVDANELVTPQSFGGTRGPSTALVAVADPRDLQVEVDVNESDLAKIVPRQPCRISPEAYPDRHYAGYVAEIAPEANRQKGTLQLKVQIAAPDRFLTPELSAKVEFLAAPAGVAP